MLSRTCGWLFETLGVAARNTSRHHNADDDIIPREMLALHAEADNLCSRRRCTYKTSEHRCLRPGAADVTEM